MKIDIITNAELVIQANPNKDGDYAAALAIAEKMVEMGEVDCEIAAADETEQWIHVCAVWNWYQAAEMKDAYLAAKAAI